MTWEDAILWLRAQADYQDLVRHCYYDDPLENAAERFHQSEEWRATRRLLKGHLPGRVLDIGAGRGIASYAFARDGCTVTALEPEASAIVGRGAIEQMSERTRTTIRTVDARGEAMPFADATFDVVYGRAVLHHARDLTELCQEVARVLRPGGVALFVREHVISKTEDLPTFLDAHPLHPLCGGEHAYRLEEYRAALCGAGLRLQRMLGPLEDAVNFFPRTRPDVEQTVHGQIASTLGGGRWGGRLARMLLAAPGCKALATRWASRALDAPGRHFAFLCSFGARAGPCGR